MSRPSRAESLQSIMWKINEVVSSHLYFEVVFFCFVVGVIYLFVPFLVWFGWVLWHIKLCSLSNKKEVIIQTIKFSISIVFFFVYTQLNVKTFLFQTIQFSIITQFQCQKHLVFKQFSLAYKIGFISNNSVLDKYAF